MNIKILFQKRLLKYVIAGGFSYLIELYSLLSIHHLFAFSVEKSTAIAFWIGLIISFLIQKFFTFNNYHKNTKIISRQIILYAILVLINYAFTLMVVFIFPQKLIIVSRTLALIVTTLWNYIVYKKIFKSEVVLIQ